MAEEGKGKTIDSKEDIAAAMLEFEKYVERQKESIEIQKLRAKLQGEYVQGLVKEKDELDRNLSKYAEIAEKLHTIKMDDAGKESVGKFADEVGRLTKQITFTAEESEFLEEMLANLDAGMKTSAEAAEKLNIILHKASQRAKEAGNSTGALAKSITSLVGGLNLGITSSSGFASNIMSMNAQMEVLKKTTGEIKLGTIAWAAGLEATVGWFNKLGNEVSAIVGELMKGSAELAKLTGQTERSTMRFHEMTQGLYHLGVSADAAGKGFGSLINDTALLGEKVGDAQLASAQLALKLVALGVESKQLTDTINMLSRGFGLSFEESVKFYESIIKQSRIAGQSVADLSKNFGEASNRLAITSTNAEQMKEQFLGLNKMTKELGVSMSSLVNLAGKFDKFGDAANIVGKLNAQFNLGLSMTKMMRASDEERIRILKRSFTARGIQIDQLGKYEKLMIQSVLGAKDETEMLKLLGHGREAQSKGLRDLNELLSTQQDEYSRLKNSLKEFAATLGPVIHLMTLFVGWAADFISFAATDKGFGGWMAWVTLLVPSLFLAAKMF